MNIEWEDTPKFGPRLIVVTGPNFADMTDDAADDLIGAAEAAILLGISRTQLARLARRGTLAPIVKLKGKTGAYMFGRTSVLALKQARESPAEETKAAS